MKAITRRRWLTKSLGLAALPGALEALEPGEEKIDFVDDREFQIELQEQNPRVKCYDLRRLPEPLTPNSKFFVFHQTSVPAVAMDKWKLEIGGCVDRPAAFTMSELAGVAGPIRELEFTLECSGNLPRPEIMNGQVGSALWSGFHLAAILHRCGVKPEAREAIFFGADEVRDSSGVAHAPHGRSIFIQDVLNSDAILATHMNGEPLPAEHGFPLRLIIPGWYGMAQIKWLSRIEFIDRRYEGPHMSRNYHTLHVVGAGSQKPVLLETSISRTRLKSVVARVSRRRRNQEWVYTIVGAAWGGPFPIKRVEVRIDQQPWRAARIDERRGRHAWLMWSIDVTALAPAQHSLRSRAVDIHGTVQPSAEEWRAEIRSARENNSQWERVIEVPA